MIARFRLRSFTVILAGILLGGCPSGEHMPQVNIGMTRPQAIDIMGSPDGDLVAGNTEALTYSNRLMSGWSWHRADYQILLTDGRVSAYGPGTVRQNSGPNVLMIVPFR
jgi:hypothetical protein